MTPGRQFRARQIEDAQYLAYAKRQGWVPTGYTSKAERADKVAQNRTAAAFEGEGIEALASMMSSRREARQTPYNPAKGLTGKYDPVTGGYK